MMNTRTVFRSFLITAFSLLICTALSLSNASFDKVTLFDFSDHIVLAAENKITTANLNLRTGPGTGYSIILTIPKGTTVSVLGYSGSWSKLTYNGKTGYSYSSYLVTSPAAPINPAGTAYVTTANLNLRTGPSTGYPILLTIPLNKTVTVSSISNNWANLTYNGTVGYSSATYLKKVEIIPLPNIGSTPIPPSIPEIQEVNLDRTSMALFKSGTVTLISTNKTVLWTSSNPTVASVDSNGKITANNPGNAIITATTFDGSKKDSCDIVVLDGRPKAKLLFTFDDGDINNLAIAAPIMYQRGFRGTAYVGKSIPVQYWSPGTMNENDLTKLYNYYRWDLSNHTTNHLTIGSNTDEASLQKLRQEYESNQNWLLSNGWVRGAHHAAYPFGVYSDSLINVLIDIGIRSSRTTVNGLQTTPVNSYYKLLSIDASNLSYVKSKIDSTVTSGSTTILMIHGVSPVKNDYTISTQDFQSIVDYASTYVQKSQLDVTTISEWYNEIASQKTVPVPTLPPTPEPEPVPEPVPEPEPEPVLEPEPIVQGAKQIYSGITPYSGKRIAITFDDGGDAEHIESILTSLDEFNAKSTFFVTGDWVLANPTLAQEIVNRGHKLESHSYSHPNLVTLSDEDLRNEFIKTKNIIKDTVGIDSYLIRPPFGSTDDRVLKIAGEEGYDYLVLWTVSTGDWDTSSTVDSIVSKTLNNASNNGIVTFHLWVDKTLEALPLALRELQNAGYSFTTVNSMLP